MAIINDYFQNILNWIDGLGIIGYGVFIFIYVLAAVFLIPGSLLTLGAGGLFGVVRGSILVSVASTLGAAISFLIGRYGVRRWVEKQIEKQPKFKAIDEAIGKEGWKIVGLTRLSPVFPYIFLNYAFSVTQISFRDFLLASWLGMMPGTVMFVYIGSLATDLATLSTGNVEDSRLNLIIRIIGFIATVAVTIYVTRLAKTALTQELGEEG